MTSQTASLPARTAAPLDPTLRSLRCEAARWALANGRPLNLDAVSVILGARHDEALRERRPFNRWTANSVLTFLFGTANDWCAEHGVAVPLHLGESLFTFLCFLDAVGVLAPGSSPTELLTDTVADLAGLSRDGHRTTAVTDVLLARPIPLRRAN